MPQVDIFTLEQDFLNETGDISTTTVFTPAADGNYIATISVIPAGNSNVNVNWTDPSGAARSRAVTGDLVFNLRAKGGDAITVDSDSTSGDYSAYVTFQQITGS